MINSRKTKPKNLKELLKLINQPKRIRRRDGNQQKTSSIDEGFELFDCDREQLQNDEVNVESKSDDKSKNNEDGEAANTTADNENKTNKELMNISSPCNFGRSV